jgi:hypothetical protein
MTYLNNQKSESSFDVNKFLINYNNNKVFSKLNKSPFEAYSNKRMPIFVMNDIFNDEEKQETNFDFNEIEKDGEFRIQTNQNPKSLDISSNSEIKVSKRENIFDNDKPIIKRSSSESSSTTTLDPKIEKKVFEAFDIFEKAVAEFRFGDYTLSSGIGPIANSLLKISIEFGFYTLGYVVLKIFIDYVNDENILIQVGKGLCGFDYDDVSIWGTSTVKDLLHSKSDLQKGIGIELIDNWQSKKLLDVLQSIEVKTQWVQDYIDIVIKDFGEPT